MRMCVHVCVCLGVHAYTVVSCVFITLLGENVFKETCHFDIVGTIFNHNFVKICE